VDPLVAALARPRSRDYAITLTLHHPTPGTVVRIWRVERPMPHWANTRLPKSPNERGVGAWFGSGGYRPWVERRGWGGETGGNVSEPGEM
jgi:hypothetical protein